MSNSHAGERLFMDTVHADVVFVVENVEIPGHRLIVATSCAYFDKLLNGDFKETKSVKVDINETSAKVFQEVKRFIYLGHLEIANWTTEDLLELLTVADEYQYQELLAKVMEAVEKQPMDFDSWSLVNSAAAIYDWASLKAKCVSFAEAEVDSFLRLENMEKMTEEFICFMFDTPKISTVDQDQLLSSLLQWKKAHESAQIRSVLQKICWNEVSHDTTAVISKLLLLNLKNEDEHPFFNQLIDTLQVQCIAKVDNVVFSRETQAMFTFDKCYCEVYFKHYTKGIHLQFKKNGSRKDIPVERIEFELSNQYRIQRVAGMRYLIYKMDHKIVKTNRTWFKYSATLSKAERVFSILIDSDDFTESSEITLRNLAIY